VITSGESDVYTSQKPSRTSYLDIKRFEYPVAEVACLEDAIQDPTVTLAVGINSSFKDVSLRL